MAVLTAQNMDYTGLEVTFAAADAAGDEVAWTDRLFLWVKNADASDHTLTITSEADAVPGLAVSNQAVVVSAGEDRLIGPFPRGAFRNDTDGRVAWTYDAVTSVTIAVIQPDTV